MKVRVPTPLLPYTGQREVTATGATLGELLADLDRQYPGLRFRMVDEHDHVRPHVRVFINRRQEFDLRTPVAATDAVDIVQALSGG
jgi:sulfur-carrier protein